MDKVEKPDWLNGGAIVAAIGIGAMVVAGGALIAFTGGAAAPIVIAAGLAAVGAATTTMGVFDMVEGATGQNKLKENVFNNNEMAYDTVKSVLTTSSFVGSVHLAPYAAAGYGSLLAAKQVCNSSNSITTYYPTNDGVLGKPQKVQLQPGTLIDRYGYKGGRFLSPKGTPIEMRALPPGTESKPYNIYEVVKPLNVEEGTVAPAFGKIGLGTQYKINSTVQDLLNQNIIKEMK